MTARSKMPEFAAWNNMRGRCDNQSRSDYARYGGRGVKVCERWTDFDQFLSDMGPRPSKDYSLDRIDNDRGYEPGNVRWATAIEQANNKRNSRWVIYRGERMTVADAVRVAGGLVTACNAICRLNNGWTIEETVETPPLFKRDPKTRKKLPPFPGNSWFGG